MRAHSGERGSAGRPQRAPRQRRPAGTSCSVRVGLWLAVLLLIAGTGFALHVPSLAGRRVHDLADMIDGATEARIDARLAALEAAKGHQLAVLTVPSLEGDSLEDFSLRVVEDWQLGREGVDDGALLLIARDDRKMRIEVGYGLEATLTDVTSFRIQTEILRPRFRSGDTSGGIEAGVEAIAGVLEGTDLPPPGTGGGGTSVEGAPIVFLVFLAVMAMFSLNAVFARGGCLMYFFLAPFWGAFPSALVHPYVGAACLGLWLIGFPLLWWYFHRTEAGKAAMARMVKRRRRRSRDVWSSDGGWRGGFGGGGFGGGGFGGGGFGGGGGSFGGGGSSSGW